MNRSKKSKSINDSNSSSSILRKKKDEEENYYCSNQVKLTLATITSATDSTM